MIRFLKALGACAAVFLLVTRCAEKPKTDPARAAQTHIDSLEKKLLSQMALPDKTHLPPAQTDSEMEQVLTLVKEYQLFAADFPKDTATPGILLKEGQIFHQYLKDYEQADHVYTRLIDSFPQQKQRAFAMYLLGSLRHDAGDTAAAQQVLHEVVKEYPGSFEATQSQLLSDFIRKGLPKEPQP